MNAAALSESDVSLRLNPPTVSREAVIDQMLVDVRDGIMVLAYRDGLPVTLEIATERARNIVAGLITNFQFDAYPEGRS